METMELKTNHNIRIVSLVTGEKVLCLFGEVRDADEKVVGYRMLYPYVLSLGEVKDDGSIPINYSRWCPFSPVEEHRMSGDHIISVVFPDNTILDNYAEKLKEAGFTEEQLFFEQQTEVTDGDNSEPAEAGE